MKKKIIFVLILLLVVGCSTFKKGEIESVIKYLKNNNMINSNWKLVLYDIKIRLDV